MEWQELVQTAKVKRPLLVVVLAIATLWVPAYLALESVKVVRPVVPVQPPPGTSPYGYTWSLLLWFVPALVILVSLWRSPGREVPRKAFLWTVLPLLGLGLILDVIFGNLFFTFPNQGANLGVYFPGWDWEMHRLVWNIPVEEIFFYFFGDSVALLIYLWCDLYWLDRYARSREPWSVASQGKVLAFSVWPLALGVGLVLAASLYRNVVSDLPNGFPGYFSFLVLVAFVPATLFLTKIKDRINWQAYLCTALTMVFISLIWECTIAFPFQWWGYRPEQLVGLRIRAWSNLPLEEPFLWLLVSFNAVVIFETVRALIDSDRGTGHTLLGEGWAEKK